MCDMRAGAVELSQRAGRSHPDPETGTTGGFVPGSGQPTAGWLFSGHRRPGGSERAVAGLLLAPLPREVGYKAHGPVDSWPLT